MEVKGKTALVTGGAQRVGKAMSLALAKAGANVVINYHSSGSQALDTAAEARMLGVQAMAVQADISDLEQVRYMADRVLERFGAIDILVNNASVFKQTPFPAEDFDDWHQVTGILIHGAYYCSSLFAPGMLARGQGGYCQHCRFVCVGALA